MAFRTKVDAIYEMLSAKEALGVGREVPGLNGRGEKLLRWLRRRRQK